MIKKILFVAFLPLCFSWAQPTLTARLNSSNNIDVIEEIKVSRELCGLPEINLEAEIAYLENMRINNPDYFDGIKKPRILGKVYDEVGDTASFWVIKNVDGSDNSSYVKINAKLLAKGNLTAVWVDTLYEDDGGNISTSLAEQYIQRLENETPADSKDSTMGIYELEKLYFGDTPNKDGDGIVDFLFSELSTGVAGYFTPNDQLDWPVDSLDARKSNARDVVYIKIDMTISYTEATLSHELQHLIHYNYDSNEEALYNEGLSELATIICGGEYISHSYFLSDPTISWKWENLGLAQYSMASLFAVYYSEQFGLDVIKEFIGLKSGNSSMNGLSAFTKLLENRNTGMTFSDFFKNWLIANYLDNKSVDEKYGYNLYIPHRAAVQSNYSMANQSKSDIKINARSANYIKYSSSADLMEITFNGANSIKPKYVAMEFTNSFNTVEEFADNQPIIVDHDLEKVNTAVFLVANTSDLKLTYDFISIGDNDSENSEYVELSYDDGLSDIFSYPGGSFGWLGWGGGEDKIGEGWAMRFEPLLPQNQLVEYKVLAAFEQEFEGSSLPVNSEKDFEIHVWKPDSLEEKFTDIIDPFIFSTQRSNLESDFLIVDLAPYAEQLKDHKVLYVGFLEDENIGTYMTLDENADGLTYTYAALDSGNGVYLNAFSNYSVGDKSLEGWNYMMRASYFYTDTTKPVFSAGFIQNSVFSDELDLYALGSSLLSSGKVSISAENGAENIVLNSSSLPGNDSILVVRDYRLKSSGSLNFNIKGSLKYGKEEVDTTFTFEIIYTLAKAGAKFITDGGSFNLDLPADALIEDTYIIIFRGNSNFSDSKIEKSLETDLGGIYSVSPIGKTLQKPAIITFSIPDLLVDINPEDLAIGLWNGDNWEVLQTDLLTGGQLRASTFKLGQYAVIQSLNDNLDAGIDELLPREFNLSQNFPNPFNPVTTISYDIPQATQVKLTIYDILGQEITVLKDNYHAPGRYKAKWDGKNSARIPVVSGIYFYQLKTGQFMEIKKMILVR